MEERLCIVVFSLKAMVLTSLHPTVYDSWVNKGNQLKFCTLTGGP